MSREMSLWTQKADEHGLPMFELFNMAEAIEFIENDRLRRPYPTPIVASHETVEFWRYVIAGYQIVLDQIAAAPRRRPKVSY